jgi:hypothetical protein
MFVKRENTTLFVILILIMIICMIYHSISNKNTNEYFYTNIGNNFNQLSNKLLPASNGGPNPIFKDIIINDLYEKTNQFKSNSDSIEKKLNTMELKLNLLTLPRNSVYSGIPDKKFKYLKSESHYN